MSQTRAKTLARGYGLAIVALVVLGGIILSNQSSNIAALLASTGMLGSTRATLFVSSRDGALAPGETGRLDVRVTTDVPVNVIGATLGFDPEALEIVGISKMDSFLDLWTEETAIRESAGEIHFSGGTVRKGGLFGTGTLITLVVRTKREGDTTVFFKDATVLASDGKGTALESENKPLALAVRPKTESPAIAEALRGDFNGDGRVTLTDMSILTIQLFLPYNAQYDLNKSGMVDLADLSIFYPLVGR